MGRGKNQDPMIGRTTFALFEFGILRKDRTRDAAQILDTGHSEVTGYVRNGTNTFLHL